MHMACYTCPLDVSNESSSASLSVRSKNRGIYGPLYMVYTFGLPGSADEGGPMRRRCCRQLQSGAGPYSTCSDAHEPMYFLSDTYSLLKPSICDLIVEASRHPVWVAGRPQPVANLLGITTADSRSDARIQLADLLAGVGREVARLAMDGTLDDELQVAAHEMLDINVMAPGGSALDELVDRRPLPYRDRWVAENCDSAHEDAAWMRGGSTAAGMRRAGQILGLTGSFNLRTDCPE